MYVFYLKISGGDAESNRRQQARKHHATQRTTPASSTRRYKTTAGEIALGHPPPPPPIIPNAYVPDEGWSFLERGHVDVEVGVAMALAHPAAVRVTLVGRRQRISNGERSAPPRAACRAVVDVEQPVLGRAVVVVVVPVAPVEERPSAASPAPEPPEIAAAFVPAVCLFVSPPEPRAPAVPVFPRRRCCRRRRPRDIVMEVHRRLFSGGETARAPPGCCSLASVRSSRPSRQRKSSVR